MAGRTLFDHRIHQRDTDGATQVAHQIEQRARIRKLILGPTVERQPRGRQKTEHDRHTAQHLWEEEFPEVPTRRLEAVGDQPCREQRVTHEGKLACVDAGFEERSNGGSKQLCRAGHNHDLADVSAEWPRTKPRKIGVI